MFYHKSGPIQPIQPGPLPESFLKLFVQGNYVADTISESSKSTTETMDILVRSDYFIE